MGSYRKKERIRERCPRSKGTAVLPVWVPPKGCDDDRQTRAHLRSRPASLAADTAGPDAAVRGVDPMRREDAAGRRSSVPEPSISSSSSSSFPRTDGRPKPTEITFFAGPFLSFPRRRFSPKSSHLSFSAAPEDRHQIEYMYICMCRRWRAHRQTREQKRKYLRRNRDASSPPDDDESTRGSEWPKKTVLLRLSMRRRRLRRRRRRQVFSRNGQNPTPLTERADARSRNAPPCPPNKPARRRRASTPHVFLSAPPKKSTTTTIKSHDAAARTAAPGHRARSGPAAANAVAEIAF